MERYKLACQVLPIALRKIALGLTPREMVVAEELRLRVGQPLGILLPNEERRVFSKIQQVDLEISVTKPQIFPAMER
ncbi:hypothetical protein RFF05_00015 [Bengtsoniella intestinalis]|uniref:hypothetical protein n=1 Tax=Bengtsoniella intestinalis TaxID=3073143 RepID=UPI00391F8D2B